MSSKGGIYKTSLVYLSVTRYERQIKAIGEDSQRKLEMAKVAIVGVGGLGCAVSQYLAAAGVSLKLVDFDRIDESNLARQTLYEASDVGKHKAHMASQRLRRQNPHVTIEPIVERIDKANVLLINADVIVDCTDNLESRFIISDYARKTGKPYIYGACSNWTGAVGTLTPTGPCLRCVLEDKKAPPKGALGPAVGTIGSLQALAAIRAIILPPKTEWLFFEGDKFEFTKVKLSKRAGCSCQ